MSGHPFDDRFAHESFGVIAAAHNHGSGPRLFMSSHRTHHSVTVRISAAYVSRALSNDYVGEGDQFVEIEMTEAQWAAFISRTNSGNGHPCTIRYYRAGDLKKAAPPPEAGGTRETFSKELREHAKKMTAGLRAAVSALDRILAGGPVSKTKLKEARDDLSKAFANDFIDGGLGFTMAQGELWLDKMVESAKVEIGAHAAAGLRGIALEAVASTMSPAEKEALLAEIKGASALRIPTDGGHS